MKKTKDAVSSLLKGPSFRIKARKADDIIMIDKEIQVNIDDENIQKRLYLINLLPFFSGTSDEDFEIFLKLFLLKLITLHVNENDRIALLITCIIGAASDKIIKKYS